MDTYYSMVTKQPTTVKIQTNTEWHVRLYYLITNPFTYLFKGVVRY